MSAAPSTINKEAPDASAPRIAHIIDKHRLASTGALFGICGTRLRGEAPSWRDEKCVVCSDLGGDRAQGGPE